ncbi:AraC family transcriptional regulator [Streptomyces sp. NPDC006668]|uniref:AraC family transcriptional regulator n=1 Tax=Streptomyces sp. NPDC006668 TaxID=3156903 RepID=UPI0033EE7522
MDVLSDVITAMRIGRARSLRVEHHGPFAGRLPTTVPGAGFHVVLQGTCWLVPRHGAPVPLESGDVAFLRHGSEFGIADHPSTPMADAPIPTLVGASIRHEHTRTALAGNSRHAQATPTVMLCGAYLLDESRPHPLLQELPELIHLPARQGQRAELRSAIELLNGELKQPREGSDAIVRALLDMLLLYILRTWHDAESSHHKSAGWAAALRDPATASALQAIHADPSRQWTVGELAAHAGVSRPALARRFTALLGRPPLSYLTWWRMTIAARLLRESDAPLATVANNVGYTSEFAFANAFKRAHGTAPGRYRRQP